jgi:tRNA 2-thiocytidine biosynthesis protein TtcA
VIRPLAYCKEKDLEAYADAEEFRIIPCNLCGSQKNLQRQVIKDMMQEWDKKFPGRLETMFTALRNVQPSHLVDNVLYDFQGLRIDDENMADSAAVIDQVSFDPKHEETEMIK